jgi:hypothetical protein
MLLTQKTISYVVRNFSNKERTLAQHPLTITSDRMIRKPCALQIIPLVRDRSKEPRNSPISMNELYRHAKNK